MAGGDRQGATTDHSLSYGRKEQRSMAVKEPKELVENFVPGALAVFQCLDDWIILAVNKLKEAFILGQKQTTARVAKIRLVAAKSFFHRIAIHEQKKKGARW